MSENTRSLLVTQEAGYELLLKLRRQDTECLCTVRRIKPDQALRPEMVLGLLSAQGVTVGIREDEIREMCRMATHGRPARDVLVARGVLVAGGVFDGVGVMVGVLVCVGVAVGVQVGGKVGIGVLVSLIRVGVTNTMAVGGLKGLKTNCGLTKMAR